MRPDDLKSQPYSFLKDGRLQSKNLFKFSDLKLSELAKTEISSN